MEEAKRSLSLRAVLAALVVASAVAVFWAASALAAGGSPSSEPGARDSPTASAVQNEGEAPDDDCPNHGRTSESSSET